MRHWEFWNYWVCSNAVLDGHYKILKWARENGCDWDYNVRCHAINNNHVEIFEWGVNGIWDHIGQNIVTLPIEDF